MTMNLPADYAFRIARTVVTSDRTSYIDDLFSRGQLLAEVESHLCSDVNETAQRLHELTQDFAITPRDQQFTTDSRRHILVREKIRIDVNKQPISLMT